METEEVKTDSGEIALVALEDVDRILHRAASTPETEALAVQLPTRYRCRLREIRTKDRGTLSSLFDVAEVWMAYFPGCFAQPWGYRRALMV